MRYATTNALTAGPALAADNLQKLGFADVRSIAGGIEDWAAAGLPLPTGPADVRE